MAAALAHNKRGAVHIDPLISSSCHVSTTFLFARFDTSLVSLLILSIHDKNPTVNVSNEFLKLPINQPKTLDLVIRLWYHSYMRYRWYLEIKRAGATNTGAKFRKVEQSMKNPQKQCSTKEVTVTARIEYKASPEKVIYQVLSSDESTTYNVYMYRGKACSCNCPATRRCYHMDGCEAKEASRQPAAKPATPCKADVIALMDAELSVAAINQAAYARYSAGYHDLAC